MSISNLIKFCFFLAFSDFEKMEPSKQADLLLLTTIGIFIILTFFAFLLHEGKDMLVKPVWKKIKEILPCCECWSGISCCCMNKKKSKGSSRSVKRNGAAFI